MMSPTCSIRSQKRMLRPSDIKLQKIEPKSKGLEALLFCISFLKETYIRLDYY